jgi:large subunit ribosomal protein L22
MLAKAKAKYVRMSARKARLVGGLIRNKNLEEAGFILDNTNKRACGPIKKVILSAFANANQTRTEKLLMTDVYISGIQIDGGPMFRRYRAATMGRATPIRHRTSHICVQLDEVIKEKQTDKKEAGSR